MRLIALCILVALTGCATTRTINITTTPAGANIDVDGVNRGKAPLTYQFTFETDTDVHWVTPMLSGYKEQPVPIRRDYEKPDLAIDLKPLQHKLNILVEPAPAIVSVNNRALNSEPVSTISTGDLDFTKDARGLWTTYTITAERKGFQKATQTASGSDKEFNYTLTMKPMEKELNVTTNPPGARIFFDDDLLGISPVEKVTRPFPYDVTTETYFNHTLRAELPGYLPATKEMSWDDGNTSYTLELQPRSKTIRFHTSPPAAVVTMDGKALDQDAKGDSLVTLSFPPTNAQGELKSYTVVVSKKTADSEWVPKSVTVGWENGRTDYPVTLKEIRTMKLSLLGLAISQTANGREPTPSTEDTIAAKYIDEDSKRALTDLTPQEVKGQSIDSLAVSPDGKRLLFTVLVEKPEFHSLLYSISTEPGGAAELLNSGKTLDVTPAFSPGGDQILCSSDRAGNRLSVWSTDATGSSVWRQYTNGDTNDLWPNMDSDPKPRLFCQSFTDRSARPRVFATQIGTLSRSDLGIDGGMQPRINARNDEVLFSAYNEKTRKRDIFKISDQGGVAVNLTNTMDVDEYDAIWDRDGGRIAFTSDQGIDEDKRHNADIWMLDVSQPSTRTQLTTNPSVDDRPAFDPRGKAIYFRSNRGGYWGIWKISLK